MPGKCRIGNWQEEIVFEEDRKRLQDSAKETGGLLSHQILSKVRHHKKVCSLQSLLPDGHLRFNAPLMLQNAETDGFLSTDIDDKLEGENGWKVACTTARSEDANLRNSFVFVPAKSADDPFFAGKGETDVVHYGQKFAVQTHPDLLEVPMYLLSQLKTPTSKSKVTANQEVYLSEDVSMGGLWSLQYANADYRMEMEGQPVKANALCVVSHTTSNTPLASTKATCGNDFGVEFEVCAARLLKFKSRSGNAPGDKPMFWAMVTGPAAQ